MRSIPSAPFAVLTATAVLLAVGCTGDDQPDDPATTTPPPDGTDQVSWEPCPELPEEVLAGALPASTVEDTAYECATVAVPQDWDAPDAGETFDIAVVRARSDAQTDRLGSVIINPGGPGGSGVEQAVHLTLPASYGGLPEEVTTRFDIVGFDPRGVSRSDPVECYTDAELDESFGTDPDLADEDLEQELAESARIAEDCGEKYGETLNYLSTRQTAHDLDAIRAAAGDDQITYLGFSYGTLLGAVYAQQYPEQIRAMVLDGAVDPTEDAVTATEGQAAGFELAFSNFADWCDATPAECPLGPDSRSAVTDAIEQARTAPVAGNDGREATAGWVFWAVVSTLYLEDLWPLLGSAIDELANGDPSGVFQLVDAYTRRSADGSYPNLFDALTAINCVDEDSEVTVEQALALRDEWRDKYPLFGAPLAVDLAECALWPAESDPYPTGPAEGAPPILVVGTTGDPATPYESAPRLAEMLGVGVVLTYDGEGHTAYPGTDCVNETVNAYLIDLAVPDDGTTCPGS